MAQLVLENTAVAQWHTLVTEAADSIERHFDEEMESYLVFLLHRFTQRPEIAKSVMAMEFLQTMHSYGSERNARLRNVGDQCLLFAGFFPEQAQKRCVKVTYFINLGRTAYAELADTAARSEGRMFSNLSSEFIAMTDVLQAMRNLDADKKMDPLLAMEIWQELGGQTVADVLSDSTKGNPVANPSYNDVKH